MRVMDGQTVAVEVRTAAGVDRLGNPVVGYAAPVDVPNVLVNWQTAAERDYTRPDGFVITCICAFPRSCSLDMEGARLTIDGETLYVDGKPQAEIHPTKWGMTVNAGVSNG